VWPVAMYSYESWTIGKNKEISWRLWDERAEKILWVLQRPKKLN